MDSALGPSHQSKCHSQYPPDCAAIKECDKVATVGWHAGDRHAWDCLGRHMAGSHGDDGLSLGPHPPRPVSQRISSRLCSNDPKCDTIDTFGWHARDGNIWDKLVSALSRHTAGSHGDGRLSHGPPSTEASITTNITP